ncbi:MAG: TetR/AcrR family transcriptional regulator [Dehalococcoidia bacterium]
MRVGDHRHRRGPDLGGMLRPEPGRHDKEGRQRALVDAAIRIFAERGFDAATTREVALLAGCSEGLIHRYFGGKDGLLRAALEERSRKLMADAEVAVPGGDDLADELARLLVWSFDSIWAEQDATRLAMARAAVDRAVGRGVSRFLDDGRTAAVKVRLERHRAAGRVRPDVDLDATARLISGMTLIGGFFGQLVFARDREEVKREARAQAALIARGLAR